MEKRKISQNDMENIDYQVKRNELAKEIVFLRQYGKKHQEESTYENIFDKERGL